MSHDTSVQPKLGALLAGYLERQSDAQSVGIADFDGEVTPYEVGPLQPLDPKLAWDEALAVLAYYDRAGGGWQKQKAPPHWAQLVSGHESLLAVAFCVGNFPQLVRNFHQILTEPNLHDGPAGDGRPAAVDLSAYVGEAGRMRQMPGMLIALGTLRLAGQFDAGAAFIKDHEASVPADWHAAWENEKAALAWHAGRLDDARALWAALPPTAPVQFNRGMSALFAGDLAAATDNLGVAIAQLPPASAWHHLGRLYLTLAGLKGRG